MKRRMKTIYGICTSAAMLVIILNGGYAANSIQSSINLCIQTVIPALFPFFILSCVLNSCFIGQQFRFLDPIRKLCRIQSGTESILLVGLLAGYPVGAQLITDAYQQGALSKENAHRMLGFCSNAGPAFLFGMLATAFSKPVIPWILWGIHILSALITAWLLPGGETNVCQLKAKETITLKKALEIAIKNIAAVCGWIIFFRLLLDFLTKWFLAHLAIEIQVFISGFIELSNGCLMLQQIQQEGTRFVLAAAMLGFGGFCVVMQTRSVTGVLGTGLYFPGKLLQMSISVIISCIIQYFLFPHYEVFNITMPLMFTICVIAGTIIYMRYKNSCSIWQKNVV